MRPCERRDPPSAARSIIHYAQRQAWPKAFQTALELVDSISRRHYDGHPARELSRGRMRVGEAAICQVPAHQPGGRRAGRAVTQLLERAAPSRGEAKQPARMTAEQRARRRFANGWVDIDRQAARQRERRRLWRSRLSPAGGCARSQRASPPSIGRSAPVMPAPPGPASQTIKRAISSGSSRRSIGCCAANISADGSA